MTVLEWGLIKSTNRRQDTTLTFKHSHRNPLLKLQNTKAIKIGVLFIVFVIRNIIYTYIPIIRFYTALISDESKCPNLVI